MQGVVFRRGEGDAQSARDAEMVVKAQGGDPDSLCFFAEAILAPGFVGFPPHRHQRTHEVFYVLEGALWVRLGEESLASPPGSYVCAPPGVVHTFSNPGAEPVRFLNLRAVAADWGAFTRELSEARSSGSLTPELAAEISERYDIYLA